MEKKTENRKLGGSFASVELEGYKLNSYHREQCQKVIDGKISKEDYIRQLLKKQGRA